MNFSVSCHAETGLVRLRRPSELQGKVQLQAGKNHVKRQNFGLLKKREQHCTRGHDADGLPDNDKDSVHPAMLPGTNMAPPPFSRQKVARPKSPSFPMNPTSTRVLQRTGPSLSARGLLQETRRSDDHTSQDERREQNQTKRHKTNKTNKKETKQRKRETQSNNGRNHGNVETPQQSTEEEAREGAGLTSRRARPACSEDTSGARLRIARAFAL